MADINDVYNMLQLVADALGAGEGYGGGYGDSNMDGAPDPYATYGQGPAFSLYAEMLNIRRMLQERLDVPVSSREAALKEPGHGPYFVARIIKDDTDQHVPIFNALVEAGYSGTGEIIRSTRTNAEGKFALFFDTQDPVDVTITSDSYQGVKLYGVIPQSY
jgi:hypothetical protein